MKPCPSCGCKFPNWPKHFDRLVNRVKCLMCNYAVTVGLHEKGDATWQAALMRAWETRHLHVHDAPEEPEANPQTPQPQEPTQ